MTSELNNRTAQLCQTLEISLLDWEFFAPEIPQLTIPASDCANRAAGTPSPQIPMMTARRLSLGSRYAIQCALAILARNRADALLFSSRNGESERTTQIIAALAAETAISPTNFTMAVHNAAVGQLAISAQQTIPAVSVAAGAETFRQSLYEVRTFFEGGYENVLHVDFETTFPEVYRPIFANHFPAYATAFLWKKSVVENGFSPSEPEFLFSQNDSTTLPPSVAFLRDYTTQKIASANK